MATAPNHLPDRAGSLVQTHRSFEPRILFFHFAIFLLLAVLTGGLTYRRYLNSSRTAISPYVGANLGFEVLVWEYRNPIVSGGDTIRHDDLSAGQGAVVFGVSTRRDKPLGFFGEVGLGGTLFFSETDQGFKNDVFDNYGFFSVKAGLSFKF